MNQKRKNTVSRLLTGALGLLGFVSCDDGSGGEVICEYGTPYTLFRVKGKVTSETGEPLKDIQVIVRTGWSNHPIEADTVYTDEKGEFRTEDDLWAVGIGEQKVYFNDVDGEANGGTFRSDSLGLAKDFDVQKMEDGKGWYTGKSEFSTKSPVKMKTDDAQQE